MVVTFREENKLAKLAFDLDQKVSAHDYVKFSFSLPNFGADLR